MRRKQPAHLPGITWAHAGPKELAAFDPASKVCVMNCGPTRMDPRSAAERRLLCDECLPAKRQPEAL